MTPDTQDPQRMHLAAEIPLYPFHFIARAIVRAIRLLAAIIALALASVVILAALFVGWQWADSKLTNDEIAQTLLIVVALLASLGLLATVFTKAGEAIRSALKEIGEELLDLVQHWVPQLNAKKSLADAKDDFLSIGPTLGTMYSAPYKIILPLSLILFLIFSATRIINADADWKKGVSAALASPTVVVVVPAEGEQATPDIPPTPLCPGTTFAIAHLEQGSLEDGNGICLDDNISLPWLTEFKKALTHCGEKTPECRPEVVVRAFASIAPIRGDDQEPVAPEAQEKLNCEIANRRAEQVVDFLRLSNEYTCDWEQRPRALYRGEGDDKLCQRKDKVFKFGQDDGLAFDLIYEPWQSHEAMVADKPANDGGPPPRARWPGVEFLNRSVQLTVRDYGCDPEQCNSAAQTGSGAAATEASGRQTPAPSAVPATTNTTAPAASN